MKLKVIGWTYYDDPNYEYFETTWATQNAVLKDVIKNKYVFTGYHHQEQERLRSLHRQDRADRPRIFPL